MDTRHIKVARMLKARACKLCGSRWHTAMSCPTRPRTGFKAPKQRLRPEAPKTRERRQQTSQEWYRLHEPPYYCYISKHPQCPKLLTKKTMVLEHDRSKARHPEDKYNVDNLYPACQIDNYYKGSMSAEEYLNKK